MADDKKKPDIWKVKATPTRDSDDKRGKWRKEIDKSYGRGFFRYLGEILELKFPHIDIKITSGTSKSEVATSLVHTCPINTINGDVIINGNVRINGTLHVTGNIICDADVIASGISLVHHTHMGAHGQTSSPS